MFTLMSRVKRASRSLVRQVAKAMPGSLAETGEEHAPLTAAKELLPFAAAACLAAVSFALEASDMMDR